MSLVIVLASDDNYVRHLAATLLSVANHVPLDAPRPMFYVLDAGITADNKAKLEDVAASADAGLAFLNSKREFSPNIPLKRYGLAALLRLDIANLLPPHVERAIYMDCDMLALADLTPLMRIDLSGHPLGAVENLGHQPVERLGIPLEAYFNSGLLVIDVTLWRQRNLGEQVIDYMSSHPENLHFPDQDGLNILLHHDWQRLPLRWNQQPATYSIAAKLKASDPRKQQFADAIANPAVVHFLGRNKPWDYMTFHPLKEYYWYFLAQTPWHDAPCRGKTPVNMLRKMLMLEKILKRIRRQRLGPSIPAIKRRC